MQISFFKCLFVIIVIVLLMNSRQHFTTFTQSFFIENNKKFAQQGSLEEYYPSDGNEIGMKLLSRLLNVKFLRNKDEVKKFIYPVSMDEKIVSISLGIGNDNQVEKQLKEIFKNIELFGADPFEATAGVFREVGRVDLLLLDRNRWKNQWNRARGRLLQNADDPLDHFWELLEKNKQKVHRFSSDRHRGP
ncbi:unnamed protein product, partial [Mesorhabditis belari]|uniref:Uncharacterized protein n=1 Tax=Mesorhabditis belari TaxID=2138241 RepID=A0AAF3ECQ2_9BILA